jgi:hypothetical protein
MAKKKVKKKKGTKRKILSKLPSPNKKLQFKTAFNYPFAKGIRMWNILWILVPFFGWFALGGYIVRINKEFLEGKYEKLPMMDFSSDLKLGFIMFLKAIPFILVYIIVLSVLENILGAAQGLYKLIELFVNFFITPILALNFVKKMTVDSFFEFSKLKYVFDNFTDYLITLLKAIGLFAVFAIMCVVLIGIPALAFTQDIFMADFYRRKVK